MSRCFPLPRPGTDWTETRALFPKNYAKHKKEKKDKHKRREKETDEGRSKDKHREKKDHKENQENPEQNHTKKHKKEKKDKQKRGEKERTDKGKSKDKNKEKKDHKENHKDKSHKDSNRDEGRSSEGSSIEEERSDGYSELKYGDCSHGKEIKESKLKEVLDKRIKDEDNCTMNNVAEDSTWSIQGRTKGMGVAAAVEKQNCTGIGLAVNIARTGKRRTDETSQPEDTFARSIKKAQKVEAMGLATVMEKASNTSNGNMVTKLNGTEKIRNHPVDCTVEAATGSNKEGANKVSNSIAITFSDVIGTEQRKNQGLGTSVHNTIKKCNDISSVADGCINKRKSDKMSASLHENGAWPKKIQRTNVSSSLPLQNGRALERDQIARHSISHESSISSQKINGIMSKPNAAEPQKIPLTNISSNLPLENGRASKHGQIDRNSISPEANISSQKINDKTSQPSLMSSKSPIAVDSNYHKRRLKSQEDDAPQTRRTSISPNNSEPCQIEKHSVSPPAMKPFHANDAWINEIPSTSVPSNLPLEKGILESCHVAGGTSEGIVPSKPPHPDSEYLSQLYQIPKMDELPEFSDEEWLFCSDGDRIKPKTKLKDEEGPLVWANAMRIESPDMIALPYVMLF